MSNHAIAFLGTAHIHTPGFIGHLQSEGVPIVAVYDHDENRARKNADAIGARVAALTEAIHDPAITAFVICSETNRHETLVAMAAATGKPLFVEKPIGIDANSSAGMATAIEQGGGFFQTGYRMRGQADIQAVRKLMADGFFGTANRVRTTVCHSGALGGWFDQEWRWMADRTQAGVGAFGDLGTHGLDILLWLFGRVERVTGVFSMGTGRYEGCEEFGEALLRFESGAVGTLAASWDDVANPIRLEIAGTGGHALIGPAGLSAWGSDGNPVEITLEPEVRAGFDGFVAYLQGAAGEFVTPREAAYCDAVMEAIYRGAEGATWARPE